MRASFSGLRATERLRASPTVLRRARVTVWSISCTSGLLQVGRFAPGVGKIRPPTSHARRRRVGVGRVLRTPFPVPGSLRWLLTPSSPAFPRKGAGQLLLYQRLAKRLTQLARSTK